jgi:hypothetical protein
MKILRPNSLVRKAQRDTAELALFLRQEMRERRIRLTHLSRELGYAPEYLGRALGGSLDLKWVDVFAVLAALGASPHSFFARHYPRSGKPAPPADDAAMLTAVKALLARAGAAPRVPQPEVIDDLTVGLLGGLLTRAALTLAAAAERLGWTEYALGEVLRGRAKLRAWHVFALVAATGGQAADFFHDLMTVAADQVPLPEEVKAEVAAVLARTGLEAGPPAATASPQPTPSPYVRSGRVGRSSG